MASHNLVYLDHNEISPKKELEISFQEDVNPFLNVYYSVKFHEVRCRDDKGNGRKIYIKWYRSRSIFKRSKGYFLLDNYENPTNPIL